MQRYGLPGLQRYPVNIQTSSVTNKLPEEGDTLPFPKQNQHIDVGTCEASRFESSWLSNSIQFERDWLIRKFLNRIGRACSLIIVSLVKQFKPLTVLSGIAYRLTSCMSIIRR